jgi:hypothetical protein
VLPPCCFFIWLILPLKPALTATHTTVRGSNPHVDQTNKRESGVRATDSKFYNGPELLSCGRNTNNCCLRGERCGSNLLCYNPSKGTIARQYCADPDWNGCSTLAPSKPSTLNMLDVPLTSTKEFNAAGKQLTECRNNTVTVGDSCQADVVWFVDPADGTVYNTSLKSSTASPTYWSIDSSAILASATASGSSVISSALSATVTPTSGPGSATVSDTSPTANAPPANTSSAASPPSGLSAGAGAGIGIGAAAAVGIVAVAVWLYIRKRRRQSASQESNQKPFEADTSEALYPYAGAHKASYAHDAHETVAQAPRQELGGHTRSELP